MTVCIPRNPATLPCAGQSIVVLVADESPPLSVEVVALTIEPDVDPDDPADIVLVARVEGRMLVAGTHDERHYERLDPITVWLAPGDMWAAYAP
jgi:hypothetical protein